MAFVFSCAYEDILHLGSFYTKRKKSTFLPRKFSPSKDYQEITSKKKTISKNSLNLKFLLWSILYY